MATVNLLHGQSIHDGTVDPDRLRAELARLDAEVVALQEVDRNLERSGCVDQTAIAASSVADDRPVWSRFVATLIGDPDGHWRPAVTDECGVHPTADPTSAVPAVGAVPAYGIAMVSRLEVRAWHVIRFAPSPIPAPLIIPGSRRPVLIRDEPRAALIAEIAGPGGAITVAATHLSFVPGWNAGQLRRLSRLLLSMPPPRIILGDLNLPGSIPSRLTGWRSPARVATYPSPRPRIQFDHVLLDDPTHRFDTGPPRSVPTDTIPTGAVPAWSTVELAISDHRALVVDLRLTGDSATRRGVAFADGRDSADE